MPNSNKTTREIQNCPFCGQNSYYRDIRSLEFTYKAQSIVIKQPGYWCDACGESCIEGTDLKDTREELQAFPVRIDGSLTPQDN